MTLKGKGASREYTVIVTAAISVMWVKRQSLNTNEWDKCHSIMCHLYNVALKVATFLIMTVH